MVLPIFVAHRLQVCLPIFVASA